jgi:PAS domain-containing protein
MFPLNMELGAAFLPSGMAFFSWDLATDRLYGDAAMAGLFNAEVDEMAAGMPILSLIERIAVDDRARIAAAVHRAITTGLLFQEQYRIDHGGRGSVEVFAVGRCLRDASGIPFIYNGTIVEVPARAGSASNDPLTGYCRSALDLAERQGNELAARYLSSALKVIGAT